jgi:rRNA-processing protein FCF1
MRVIMDADCLVKLTRAGLKEIVVTNYTIHIPRNVKEEVVDAGIEQNLSDAYAVSSNIRKRLVHVIQAKRGVKGEQEVLDSYESGDYDFIASDDKRFIRILKATGIPYIVPASFIYGLYVNKNISINKAKELLNVLSPFVSDDQVNAVRILFEEKR